MPNFNYDDGQLCSYCCCDLEVIGPPGPIHNEKCPYENFDENIKPTKVSDENIKSLLKSSSLARNLIRVGKIDLTIE